MKALAVLSLFLVVYVLSAEGFLFKKNGTLVQTTKAPKPEKCMIVKGKGKNLIGDTIFVHKDFLSTLKAIDNVAQQCNVKLSVKGSYESVADPTKVQRFTAANLGRQIKFVVMDKTGKKIVCNNICLAKEGEKVPEVKCLAVGLRKELLVYAPRDEAGTVSDGSESKAGFFDAAQRLQIACKGAKF